MGAYYFFQKLWEDKQWSESEIRVEGERFVRSYSGKEPVVEMDLSALQVTPGNVFVDTSCSVYHSPDRQSIAQAYLKKGCTLLIIPLPISSSMEYKHKYHTFLTTLEDFPLDYMVAPLFPPRLLDAAAIRYFGRQKCPIILVGIERVSDMEGIGWEWFVQAQSHSRIPISPLINEKNVDYQKLWSAWKALASSCEMITLEDRIGVDPLPFRTLRQTGIYPYKGAFIAGGYADYNLYLHHEAELIDDCEEFSYHDAIPNVTIMNGKVLMINQKMSEENVRGRHLTVSIPKHFL
ncbi:hypothetical protein [Thalassobacillus hwangdonensis]|uniref:Uncharacterized protein n=1 Tax=Thalassobacillus hwangdonensis TaxID=546108 RepID=A0ABW3KXU1_9BACI